MGTSVGYTYARKNSSVDYVRSKVERNTKMKSILAYTNTLRTYGTSRRGHEMNSTFLHKDCPGLCHIMKPNIRVAVSEAYPLITSDTTIMIRDTIL